MPNLLQRLLRPLKRLPSSQPQKPKKLPQKLGPKGESLAKRHLQNKGYRFIAANYTTPLGEIDLIFQTGQTLVFVEVKTRKSLQKGLPQEAVDQRKLRHIHKSAQYYLSSKNKQHQTCRIDVVAILDIPPQPQITHLENVTGF